MNKNPFPGLRPFDASEYKLFFGRENQIDELRKKLARTHFLAIVGTSGSGKSSLIRAGFLPTLNDTTGKPDSRWRIAVIRPGNDPIGNLAAQLNSKDFWGEDDYSAERGLFTESALRHGSLGLANAIKEFRISGNILILIDQFEELFRFKDEQKPEAKDDALKFVKLLLEASSQRNVPIYVALTMRSDYLGDCPQFKGLPEAINDSQYLIPRLTRGQIRDAIQKPIDAAGGRIASSLLSNILNDIEDSQDYLPILQHALMRTYDAWLNDPARPAEIDFHHYESIGGMKEALSNHADEVYGDLSPIKKLHAESLFKSLTEIDSDARIVRRPCSLEEIASVAKTSEAEMATIVEAFRAPGRSFIMPPYQEALSRETILDISHESLMRCWDRLKKWIKDEQGSARTYRHLADSAVLYHDKKGDLLRNPGLEIALDWRAKQTPTTAWAKRYNPDFDLTIDYLDLASTVVG